MFRCVCVCVCVVCVCVWCVCVCGVCVCVCGVCFGFWYEGMMCKLAIYSWGEGGGSYLLCMQSCTGRGRGRAGLYVDSLVTPPFMHAGCGGCCLWHLPGRCDLCE